MHLWHLGHTHDDDFSIEFIAICLQTERLSPILSFTRFINLLVCECVPSMKHKYVIQLPERLEYAYQRPAVIKWRIQFWSANNNLGRIVNMVQFQ